MKITSILTTLSVLALSTLSVSAYTEVKCSSDPVFAANSCSATDQCFTDRSRWEGSNLWELKDEWINSSTSDKLLFKEEQEMPKMINLAPSLVTWKENPSKVGFWEYTPELNKLLDPEEEGYILAKGKKVTWLKSKKWYTYTLSKNKAEEGKNIGLLKYNITTHNILDDGTIDSNGTDHKECVLFKSGKAVKQEEVVPGKKANPKTPAKKLPKTGPEHYVLLMLLAMIIGFGVMKMRKRV